MVWWVPVYLGLGIWLLGRTVRDLDVLRRTRLVLFVVQLVGLAAAHGYWVYLGRTGHPDRNHFAFVWWWFGVVCTVLQGVLLGIAVILDIADESEPPDVLP